MSALGQKRTLGCNTAPSTQVQIRREKFDVPTDHEVKGDYDPVLAFVGRALLDRMRNVAGPDQHAALFRRNNENIRVNVVSFPKSGLEIFRKAPRRSEHRRPAIFRRLNVNEAT